MVLAEVGAVAMGGVALCMGVHAGKEHGSEAAGLADDAHGSVVGAGDEEAPVRADSDAVDALLVDTHRGRVRTVAARLRKVEWRCAQVSRAVLLLMAGPHGHRASTQAQQRWRAADLELRRRGPGEEVDEVHGAVLGAKVDRVLKWVQGSARGGPRQRALPAGRYAGREWPIRGGRQV